MKNLKYIIYILFVGILAWSCDQDPIEVTPDPDPGPTTPPSGDPGPLDFSKFIAIGNSLTAGVQSGTLFDESQANSMPLILHQQFGYADPGAGSFNQPDINSENGYTGGTPPDPIFGRLRFVGSTPTPQPSDEASVPSPLNPSFDYTGSTSDLNNFGVGGILLGQALIPETGDWTLFGLDPRVNPYYARFASSPGTSTILGDALSASPTFFLFWLGSNDVLGYAASGGNGSVAITDPVAFEMQYTAAMATLTTDPELEGVVGTIPPVLLIPYFRLVPWNSIVLTEEQANEANTGYAAYNGFLDQLVLGMAMTPEEADKRKISFTADTPAGIVLTDENLTDITPFIPPALPPEQQAALALLAQARQATADDLLTLPAAGVLGQEPAALPGSGLVYGVSFPAEDTFVLLPEEQDEINAAVAAYNIAIPNVINTLGLGNRVAIADTYTALLNFILSGGGLYQCGEACDDDVQDGERWTANDGVLVQPTIVPPTAAWSEDGVHPNSRGYAFTANIFIDAINEKFGSDIPQARLASYASTLIPVE